MLQLSEQRYSTVLLALGVILWLARVSLPGKGKIDGDAFRGKLGRTMLIQLSLSLSRRGARRAAAHS